MQSKVWMKILREYSERIINNLKSDDSSLNNKKFKLWIGIIGQRRNYLGQVEFIQKLISYFLDLFSKKFYLFLMDGRPQIILKKIRNQSMRIMKY